MLVRARWTGPRSKVAGLTALVAIVAMVAATVVVVDGEGAAPVDAAPARPSVDRALRARLVDAAEEALEIDVRPRDPLKITDTDDPFVRDGIAAWTLALAAHVTGEQRYVRGARVIVDAWARVRSTRSTCPDSGACSTSLMISRAGPGFILAVILLRMHGQYGGERLERFDRWVRDVLLPAASDRDNNWGDAGTYLRVVAAIELGDRKELAEAVQLWKDRMDDMERDGRIPEEMRRGDASLMYSQEALSYRVMAAAHLSIVGIDVWEYQGARGGTLRRGLELVAKGLDDPDRWPGDHDDLRVPDPQSMWAVVAHRWPTRQFERQAEAARASEGRGHSAAVWSSITHGT